MQNERNMLPENVQVPEVCSGDSSVWTEANVPRGRSRDSSKGNHQEHNDRPPLSGKKTSVGLKRHTLQQGISPGVSPHASARVLWMDPVQSVKGCRSLTDAKRNTNDYTKRLSGASERSSAKSHSSSSTQASLVPKAVRYHSEGGEPQCQPSPAHMGQSSSIRNGLPSEQATDSLDTAFFKGDAAQVVSCLLHGTRG